MKNIFILTSLVLLLFVSQLQAQWWVRGGNLLWPYGNVEINKDLTVGGEVTFDSTVNLGDDVTIGGNLNITGTSTLEILNVDDVTTFDSTVNFTDAVNFDGATDFDAAVNIDQKLTVDTLYEGNVKELIAQVKWYGSSDPDITILKNTTGRTFTWDNRDDLGEQIDITASSSIFTSGKTFFYGNLLVYGGNIIFPVGEASSGTLYTISAYRNDAVVMGLNGPHFLFHLKFIP